MVNYYLWHWVQALQHIPYTSTLNKSQAERSYIKYILNLKDFGLVEKQ